MWWKTNFRKKDGDQQSTPPLASPGRTVGGDVASLALRLLLLLESRSPQCLRDTSLVVEERRRSSAKIQPFSFRSWRDYVADHGVENAMRSCSCCDDDDEGENARTCDDGSVSENTVFQHATACSGMGPWDGFALPRTHGGESLRQFEPIRIHDLWARASPLFGLGNGAIELGVGLGARAAFELGLPLGTPFALGVPLALAWFLPKPFRISLREEKINNRETRTNNG
ncbi:hypothetical protein C8R43DRAFT_1152567 [Mycena crocata]|nr:hypothetical protein C8R43DRAFT_1152567 [Mycena crocata]